MKSTGLVLTALVLVGGLVLAAGCIGSATEQSPEGNWILTSFGSGSTAEHPMGIISLDILTGNVTGNSGVNNYKGTVTVDTAAGTLTLSPLATTRMAGPENMMIQEQKYLAAMANVTGYKITDGSLILTDKNGNTLLTFAVMPKATLSDTAWTVDEYSGVTLEFGESGTFNGHGPVNLYFGSWYVTGTNGITFGPVGSTLMAGPEDQMAAETEFFGKLANVTGYKIVDGKLTLTDKDGKTLVTGKAVETAVPGVVLVQFAENVSTDRQAVIIGELKNSSGAAAVRDNEPAPNLMPGLILVRLPGEVTLDAAITFYSAYPEVEYVEKDHIMTINSTSV